MARHDSINSIFEPAKPLAPFHSQSNEYQVTIDPASDLEELVTAEEPTDEHDRSFRWHYFIFIVLIAVIAFRLINLQIIQGQAFQGLAKGNRIETRFIPPPRGIILDRRENLLVKNNPIYQLVLYPAQLPKTKEARQDIYHKVSEISGVPVNDIVDKVDDKGLSSLEPIILNAKLDRDTALAWQVKLSSLSGVAIGRFPNRSYEVVPGLSHLLGYIGRVTDKELDARTDLDTTSYIGKSGLELSYDQKLQGEVGREEVEVDSRGQVQRVVSNQPAIPGNTLSLHLDKELQQVMATALEEGLKKAGRKKGVAIAMDPNTGGILGMVSLPGYDNNVFNDPERAGDRKSYLSNEDQPLFNRAIAGIYPPGSVTKPIWAAAGLQEGVINKSIDIETPPEIRVGQSVFPDWKAHGHADVKKAIAESNNIFFYAIAGGWDRIKGIGVAKMKEYGTKFGWGQPTKIDLPGESKGILPDPDWKKKNYKEGWYIGDTYHMGIGQGFVTLTPIQILNAINSIANGGTLYEPRLVKEIRDENNNVIEKVDATVLRKDFIDPAHIITVREGMRQTVLEGSATPLKDIPMPIAGKTGTAQFEDKERTHAWFTGFAPFDNPTISMLVMVEGGGDSFSVAVPIAKNILSWYSEHNQELQQKP